MKRLERWVRQNIKLAQSRQTVEGALFEGSYLSYLWYRMKIFIGLTTAGTVLHLIEFILLVDVFSQRNLFIAMTVKNFCFIGARFWWGALEALRERVRERAYRDEKDLIAADIRAWIVPAIALGAGTIVFVAGYVLWQVFARDQFFSVLHFYSITTAILFAAEILRSTLHSGIFAVRRVYRPWILRLLTQFVPFLGIYYLWDYWGPWCFPAMLLMSGLASRLTGLYYTFRAYRFHGLKHWLDFGYHRRTNPSLLLRESAAHLRPELKFAFMAGLNTALNDLGPLLVLISILRAGIGDRDAVKLAFVFHLASPLIFATQQWAVLMYFDLKRWSQSLFRPVEPLFSRLLNWGALLTALVLSALVPLFGFYRSWHWNWQIVALLPLFFYSRTLLSTYQLETLNARRWLWSIGSGAIVLLLTFSLTYVRMPEISLLAALTAIQVFACLALRGKGKLVDSDFEGWHVDIPSLESWSRKLRLQAGRHRVGMITILEERRARTSKFTSETGLLEAVVGRGNVAMLKAKTYVWFEPESAKPVSSSQLVRGLAGRIDTLWYSDWASEGSSCAKLLLQHLGTEESSSKLAGEFQTRFSSGKIVRPGHSVRSALSDVPRSARKEIFMDALGFLAGRRQHHAAHDFDVSAGVSGEGLSEIFLIPRSEPGAARAEWRAQLERQNWRVWLAS